MTTDELVDDILQREGGYVDHPADRGGATNYGITAITLGAWRHLGRPATRAEVRGLTVDEARAILRAQYVRPFDWVPFDSVRAQLADFAVNSGPMTAVRALQQVLGVPVDGIAGPRTQAALLGSSWRVVNAALVGARVAFIAQIVENDPNEKVFLWGWIRRAVKFI